MTAELNIPKFEEFIAQYPVFEYRILDSSDISVEQSKDRLSAGVRTL